MRRAPKWAAPLFHVHERRPAIEQILGPLDWQRLDDKITCRINKTCSNGGWADRETWPSAIAATVDAMIAFRKTLEPYVEALAAP